MCMNSIHSNDIYMYFFLPGFCSSYPHALACEFLPVLLHDLVMSQALVTILDRLLPG